MFQRFRHLSILVFLALAACTEPNVTPMTSGPVSGDAQTVFVATTRAENAEGEFTAARARGTTFLEIPVNFPKHYRPGDRAVIRANPDPATDFSVGAEKRFDRDGFRAALRAAITAKPKGKRDLTIYVHGYFNAFYNGVFRSAQFTHDFALPGVMAHFAWPSRGMNTAYAYDRESVLYSRDAMETMLRDAAAVGTERVTIVAHSLGAMLVMETLRQIEISEPGWVHDHIHGIAFVAPDIDVEVFKSQAARFKELPDDFVIFVSNKDQVLMLASRLSSVKNRLGNTRNVQITTQGELTIVDVTALTATARSSHFIPATSPTAIQILRNSSAFLDLFPREGAGRRVGNGVRLLQIMGD